jgi:hypothetical protein
VLLGNGREIKQRAVFRDEGIELAELWKRLFEVGKFAPGDQDCLAAARLHAAQCEEGRLFNFAVPSERSVIIERKGCDQHRPLLAPNAYNKRTGD